MSHYFNLLEKINFNPGKNTIGLNRKRLKNVTNNREYRIRAFKTDWKDIDFYEYLYIRGGPNFDRRSWKYYRKTQYYRNSKN